MFWIAIAIATVVALIVTALAIPLQLDVDGELTDRLRGHLVLRWFFTLVDVPLEGRRPSTAEPAPRAGHEPEKPHKRGGSIRPALTTPGLVQRIVRLAVDLTRQVHVRFFRLDAAYGFDDPAETGQFCGALAPLLVATTVRGLDVRCRPDFTRATFEGSCAGSVSVRPLSVLGVVAGFVFSRPVWRAWRAWRQTS